jgi:hypothetical protein
MKPKYITQLEASRLIQDFADGCDLRYERKKDVASNYIVSEPKPDAFVVSSLKTILTFYLAFCVLRVTVDIMWMLFSCLVLMVI